MSITSTLLEIEELKNTIQKEIDKMDKKPNRKKLITTINNIDLYIGIIIRVGNEDFITVVGNEDFITVEGQHASGVSVIGYSDFDLKFTSSVLSILEKEKLYNPKRKGEAFEYNKNYSSNQ
jgi:hypothetical protein